MIFDWFDHVWFIMFSIKKKEIKYEEYREKEKRKNIKKILD